MRLSAVRYFTDSTTDAPFTRQTQNPSVLFWMNEFQQQIVRAL